MRFADVAFSRKLTVAFLPVLAAVGLMSGVVWVQMSNIHHATSWDAHTTDVLASNDEAFMALVTQQSTLRGFVLTTQSELLADFRAAQARFESATTDLARLTADNPAQQARIQRLLAAEAEWTTGVADPEIRLASDPATWDQAVAIARSATNKTIMAAIRSTIQDIAAEEKALLANRRAATTAAFSSASIALAGGTALAVLLAAGMGILLFRSMARPVTAMAGVMRQLAGGDKNVVIPGAGQRDEIGAIAAAVETFRQAALEQERLEAERADARRSAEAIRIESEKRATAEARSAFIAAIRPSFERLADGDLTARLDREANRDYVEVCDLFNASVESLEGTVGGVVSAVGSMRMGLSEITTAAGDLSQRTEQQAASLEETVAALAEVTRGVSVTAESADRAQRTAAAAEANAGKGCEIVGRAVAAMAEIERSSVGIGKIIGVIDEIAFQTNLLALNAGVEAARAGEAGRGFAVVAQEVRGLAQRSAEAAKEIKDLISLSTAQVGEGVELVTASGRSLEDIVSGVRDMNEVIASIARSAREQAVSLRELSTTADQMDKVTQQNAAMVEETTAAAQTLSGETEQLAGLVERFRTQGMARASARARATTPTRPQPRAAAQMRPAGRGGAAPKHHPEEESWEEF